MSTHDMQDNASSEERLRTGIRGLDSLLDGGLVRGGVYLVMGRPGTGKTTLANHLCFAHVARGERAVYVTLLAETHARMLRNLEAYDFFRPDVIGDSLHYLGAYVVLRERRLPGLLQMLRRVLLDERPTLLVIDGVSSAHTLGESDAAMKEFVAELQVMADMSGCTTVLAATMTSDEASGPEHSIVDGLIELTLRHEDQRTFREIEVLKFRGANHLLGGHDLEIASSGVIVRPRTEVLLSTRAHASVGTERRRMSTGIVNLDAMLGGGLLAGTSTMLLGFAGSGKTTLGLHFLEAGVRIGEPCAYYGFYESPDRLVEAAEGLKLPVRQHVDSGLLGITWQPPLRRSIDAIAESLLDDVEARGVRRLVIDGLDGIRQGAADTTRVLRFMTALVNELRARDVTVLLTEETQKLFGPEVEVRVEGISALVENIILLEYIDQGSELRRLLSIVKQRASAYDTAIRELCITDRGVTLAEDASSAHDMLLGMALHRGTRGRPR